MHGYKVVRQDSTYKGLSVLIVDDFEAMTKIMYSGLESLGFTTILKAKDGKEALYRLEHNQVDLIISDWKMPKMDGLQLLRHLRKQDKFKTIPFIMVTGNLHQSDVIEAIEAGVSEYLIKPFSIAKLGERIHKAFVSPIPTHAVARLKKAAEERETTDERRSILIVDDEPTNLQVLGELLKEKYKTRVCRSGAQALDICSKDDKPDIILLDIMMPEMDGLQVCKALKSDPDTEFIPIIFVSALSQTADVVKGLQLGAVDYITKPIIPEIVHARVDTHVKSVVQREKMVNQMETLVQSARTREDADQTFNHDLRNPLSAMLTTLPMLKDKAPNCAEEIEMMAETAQILANMLDNQNVMRQIEEGTYDKPLSPVAATNILSQVVDSFNALAKQKNIEVDVDVDPTHIYQGDPLLSHTMYSNLLKNAIEAAPEDTRIKVTSEREGDDIILKIHNSGEVPINIRGQFFNKFITDGKVDGKGIGAYSAKLCAMAQDGKIKLNIREGQGTTLILQLKASELQKKF